MDASTLPANPMTRDGLRPRPERRRAAAPAWALVPAVLFALAAGCSAYRTFDLPETPAHSMEHAQSRDGLLAAAQLLADPEVGEHYFGRRLRSRGYFAVIVAIENRGGSSFQIERRDFALVLEGGERFKPVSPREVLRDARVSSLPIGALLLAPLVVPPFVAHARAEEHNFEIARSLERKCFPRFLRLEPGDPPATRMLFFRETRDDRPLAAFESAVLEFVADIEGSPAPSGERPPAGPGSETSRQVGRSVTFALSLTPKEI
ncbi:MAG: hypothetical protein ACUVYA_18985 [Planctomycetota bacterium]